MKKVFTILLMAILLIAGPDKIWGQTNVPALIQTNQVWDISGSPYVISQNTYIDTGVSVKILPGTEVLSQSTVYTLLVGGELQALGTHDSTVHFENLQIELNKDAWSYDSSNGTGALFSYCSFITPGIGKRGIYANSTGVRIENCLFTDIYYAVYAMASGSAIRLEVINCTFNDSTGTSYPIYASSTYIDAVIIGNTFNNFNKGGGFFLTNNSLYMVRNTINGQNRVSIKAVGSNISCNLFKNLRSGVEIQLYAKDTINSCIFIHNTLDSNGSTLTGDGMLTVYKLFNLNNSRFNNNNFLKNSGTNEKVTINGYNPNPASSEPVDMTENYWGSTDSATIETYIKDYSDDINIFGRVDFSGFLNAQDTTCDEDPFVSTCNASYYLAVDTSDIYSLYVIHNSTGITSNTSFHWDFGDGSTSNQKYPTHDYASFGKYNLCLTLYDSAESCSSIYCDSIGIDSAGNLLKRNAFRIIVIDESDVTSIDELNLQNAISIFPNPSNGTINIETQEKGRMEVSVMDLTGRQVYGSTMETFTGQTNSMNLSNLPNGVYLLQFQMGSDNFTKKIVINK
ncbi:MAG: T9SS type A sorting domain-containing protein [Bacteroidia bacterium]